MTTSQSKIGEIHEKIEGGWAGQHDLSKNAIKREHWTKTLSVRFFTRMFAQPVRLPLGCPSICKSADCLSAHLSIFQFLGQQICHLQIFPFIVFFCPSFACLSAHLLSLFLVCCLVFCPFFWWVLDEAQYPTTPSSILQRTTTAHSYPLLPSPHCHTHDAIRIVS